jgi:hypothetical protein
VAVPVAGPAFVGTRAVEAELESKGRLDAVDPQQEFRHGSDSAANFPNSGFSTFT